MAERRSFREIVFGNTRFSDQRSKRINFFREDPVQPSSFVYGYNSSAGNFDLKDLGNGQSNSAVTACLQVLGVSFSEANLIVKSVNDDGEEIQIPNHPLEILMARPNPYMSGDVVQQYLMNSMHVYGDGYLLKERNNVGQVTALYPLIPDRVTPKGTDDKLITKYTYTLENTEMDIDPSEMIHMRLGLDPTNHKKGYAPLMTVLREIFGDESAGQLATALLSNMGVPSVMISPRDDFGLTAEEGEQIAKTYQQKVGGAKRGQPLVMSGTMSVEKMSFSPTELDIGTLRRIPEERVSAVLGVPAILAGLGAGLERATYANAKVLREYFTENKLIPMWRMVGAELTQQLLVPDYQSNSITKAEYDFSQVRALQDDEELMYKRLNIGVRNGWISVAEARKQVGLPTNEEQDVYYIPNNVIPTPANLIADTEVSEEVEAEEQVENDDDVLEQSSYNKKVIKKEGNEFCVYNEDETRRFGCYPTRELAEARLQQIHYFGESQYEEDLFLKEEVSKDTFTTIEEAEERAEELGCSGTHTHDENGELVYMPCSTHQEYERRLAENGETE
ncbi:MAG: putative portal protein [Prokaryotic dsDNA virus sp.]|nr:MAG: putative portal protein [Prokaryotic dsDNA virus sp.]QDP59774.1 MAG: putative portal protein [Prokaryotic dsDNA virus sp.]|tara:strand:- start:12738 stop:14423 length:1686 start_codon:yes stop_codon:yes gene_type:complete